MTTFAAIAGLFVAAKRRATGQHLAVHLHHTGTQLARHPSSLVGVLRLHIVSQTIGAVVGDAQRFFFAVERDDRQYRAEDLFTGDRHLVAHIGKHGGTHKVAFVNTVRPSEATGYQPSTLINALLNQPLNLVELRLGDHRADVLAFQ